MPRSFDIIEPQNNLRVLVLLFTVVPAAIALAVLYTVVKPMPPLIVLAVLLPVLVIAPNVVISRLIERRKVTLDGAALEVQAGPGNQRIAITDFDLEHARTLRLDEHPEWRPFMKTGGLGLPGLALGWFRTRELTRLFCVLTDRQRVLVLPLRGKKEAVLLSLKRPDELLSAMRDATDAGKRGR